MPFESRGRARIPTGAIPRFPTIPIGTPPGSAPRGNAPVYTIVAPGDAERSRRRGKSNAASQLQVGGPGTLIPVHYGLRRVGARIGAITTCDGALVLLCVWGEGEIDAVEQVYINDEAMPSEGITATHYLGTATQTADPTLVAAYAALGSTYTDTLPNIAYSVLKVYPKKNAGFPQVSARIRGRKVATSSGGTPTYSIVPAYVIADLITNTRYGLGASVDWDDVAALATRNSGTVGSPAEARHQLSVSIDQPALAEEWLKTLCDYAGAIPVKVGTTYRLILDAPAASVATIGEANVVDGSLSWETRSPADAPTVVEVGYTNTAETPWKDDQVYVYAPGADTGAVERRLTRVSRPGIQRHSEAYRYGVQLLNSYQTADLTIRWETFDEGIKYLPGDVVTFNVLPFSSKAIRILSIAPRTVQTWSVVAAEYDAAKWSDTVVSGPSSPDTSLPSPMSVPAVIGLAVEEEIYQVQTGLFASRIRATWVAPSSYWYLGGYQVKASVGGDVVAGPVNVPASLTEYVTGPLEENVTYTIAVAAVSELGVVGPDATQSVTTDGKTAPPSDVPYLFAYEAAGETRFEWSSAFDKDLFAHELRYGPRASATWATATLIDRVTHPARRYVTRSIPPGDWRFFIKGLDSVRTTTYPYGQESANARTTDLVVGGDPELFLAAVHDFATPTLTNMVAERLLGVTRWVSDYGGLWDAVFTSALNTYTNPLATYSGSGTSSLVTESYDLGQSYSGLFLATIQWTDVSGTASAYVEVSPDGVVWTRYAGLSAQAAGRYVRVGVETTGVVIVTALGSISVSVATLSETGVVTTSAGGAVTVALERFYTRVKTIQLTADVTAGQANPGYLNVVISSDPVYVTTGYVDVDYVDQAYSPVNSFDVQCWDGSNNLVAREVRYVFSGI